MLDIQLGEVEAKKSLNSTLKVNKLKKSLLNFFAAAILDHFWAKMFKSETTYFQYFCPGTPNL